MNHDIIVIGASAGGLEVLLGMAAELPVTLPAAVFVVLHTSPEFLSPLPDLLSHRGRLPASHPMHNEEIRAGRIYVAPADMQTVIRAGRVEVVRGPRENGHRPAADVLFRSASWAYGPRVIGVVLSGYGDCGTSGMMSIKARGGISVAQTPESAMVPDMPKSVAEKVGVDHLVHPVELPGLLARLASEPVAPETAMHESHTVDQLEGRALGGPAELVCPACQGVLTETTAGAFQSFRCHVGHAFSLQSLVSEQTEEVERALWSAVRSLEEGASLTRRLEGAERNDRLRQRFGEKRRTLMHQADVIRSILLLSETRPIPEPSESRS